MLPNVKWSVITAGIFVNSYFFVRVRSLSRFQFVVNCHQLTRRQICTSHYVKTPGLTYNDICISIIYKQ